MEREQVIAALRAHEEEFRAAGVVSVSLFGSVARGESPAHDVDVVVRLGDNFSERGLDYISRLDEYRAAAIRNPGLPSGCRRGAGAQTALSKRDR